MDATNLTNKENSSTASLSISSLFASKPLLPKDVIDMLKQGMNEGFEEDLLYVFWK